MQGQKRAYEGNPFIGMYIETSEKLTLAPMGAHPKMLNALSALGTEILQTTIMSSGLIGLYVASNPNGAVVPRGTSSQEVKTLKAAGLNVYVLPSRKNACGNNIVANSKGCIANPMFDRRAIDAIRDHLGVEVVQMSVAGYETVGASIICTEKGFVAHNDATEDELGRIESILGVKGNIGTVNMGSGFVGLGIVATSAGFVAGEATSGFEMARIGQALDLV